MKNIFILIITVSISIVCGADPINNLDRALVEGENMDAKFIWKNNNIEFSVLSNGTFISNGLAHQSNLKLPMDEGEYIDMVLARQIGSQLILAYQKTDFDSASGSICSLNWSKSTISWCQIIPGFNIDVSTNNDALYISAIGFIGRINPSNGTYIWRQDGLYQKDSAMNIIKLKRQQAENIVFSATSGISGEPLKEIYIDQKSGVIVKIITVGKT